jgi:prophage DNA circulation protein
MSWRDQLRKASFRGVEFFVLDPSATFGRRTVTHQYPSRDKPYVEDMGKKARELQIEAFVISTAANGFNYMPGRDALIAAVELAGPGVLQHPTLGELRVSILESRLSEQSKEGGLARFSITCTEAGEVTFPTASANTPQIVNSRANEAEAAIVEDFSRKFSVEDLPGFVSDSAVETLSSVTSSIGSLPRLIPIAKDALADFVPSLASLDAGLPTLIQAPEQLGEQLVSQIDDLRGLAADPADLFSDLVRTPLNELKMLRKLFDFGNAGSDTAVTSIPLSTPSRVQQAANQAAIQDLVQRASVISAVRATSETDFTVFQDASAVRGELTEKIDDLLLNTDDDTVFNVLVNMRSAMVNDLTVRGADLARLVTYTPPGTAPALAIAYDLYEDAGREAEIVSRNRVDYPGFVRGGRPLQVLADA